MATINNSGYRRIIADRMFEDYKSMKEYFRSKWKVLKEIIFEGYQLSTATFAVIDGSDFTIAAQLSAAAVVYLSTLADDSNQDLKSVWVTYQDNTGLIHGPIEHILNDDADTSVEAALGNEDINDVIDTGEGGKTILLTALAGTLNQYAGMYMVTQSGAGVGDVNLIISNTAATPTTLTVTDNTNAGADDDIIQIQEFPCNDFFRVREMYCEVAPIDAKTIRLGNHDSTAIYAGIGETARYMASSGFFTQPATICDSYLGRIKASFPTENTVTVNVGASLSVTFTPAEAHVNGGTAAITIEIPFEGKIDWQPCIKLAPATDVIIKVKKINDALHDEIFLEASYLEVNI